MNPSPSDTRASLIVRLPDAADVAAWDEFVGIYGPLVFRMAVRHGLQPADADDLTQEVFASVAKSVSDWLEREDRGKFRAWLMRIARNTAINFLTRPPYRTLGTGGDQANQRLGQVPATESKLSSEFDLEYRREIFIWAAEQVRETVDESTWQAFWLTHVQDVPIPEAAKQLGVSVGTIYVSRSRIMNKLQEVVREFEVAR